jgi:hypothetical protein
VQCLPYLVIVELTYRSANDSPRYTKQVLEFKSRDSTLVFMDATEWGELVSTSL